MKASPYTDNAPGLSGPADEDTRIAERVEELMIDWDQDAVKLAEAADYVLGFTSYSETLPQDVASVLIGHADDQVARDLRFMADLRSRVRAQLREVATEQAEHESEKWIPWHEVQRRRALRSA